MAVPTATEPEAEAEPEDPPEPEPEAERQPEDPRATIVLASLRHRDPRLLLSEREVTKLAPAVTDWLERGAAPQAVVTTLTDRLPPTASNAARPASSPTASRSSGRPSPPPTTSSRPARPCPGRNAPTANAPTGPPPPAPAGPAAKRPPQPLSGERGGGGPPDFVGAAVDELLIHNPSGFPGRSQRFARVPGATSAAYAGRGVVLSSGA